jgi:hypothetical protein
MRRILMAMEDLLSGLPRVVLLLLAVVVLRNPLADGAFFHGGDGTSRCPSNSCSCFLSRWPSARR